MHRGRSYWFLLAITCLAVAMSGCERTISGFDVVKTGGGGDNPGDGNNGGDTGGSSGDDEFQDDL